MLFRSRPHRISKNELEISLGGYNLSLGDLPGDGNLELADAPTSLCYHHIDAAYDCSTYYQLSNLFCLCPGQQATTSIASSTKIYKTITDQENITHP